MIDLFAGHPGGVVGNVPMPDAFRPNEVPACSCDYIAPEVREAGMKCSHCVGRESFSRLGSVPRGFFETAQECDASSPAFIRGMLMPRADYDALPLVAQPPQMSKTTLHLTPRWALYGGPLSTKQIASEWQTWMQVWAPNQGLFWQPFDEPCIVQDFRIKWPANSSFQWTWVREVYPPQRVIRTPGGKYVWENPQ